MRTLKDELQFRPSTVPFYPNFLDALIYMDVHETIQKCLRLGKNEFKTTSISQGPRHLAADDIHMIIMWDVTNIQEK